VQKCPASCFRDGTRVANQTRAFFTLYNFPVESDETVRTEKSARNRHRIIMALWLRAEL
jgi:hypothetical protein